MAIRYLKESKSQSERREDDAKVKAIVEDTLRDIDCLLYTSPSPRDMRRSRMPSSA